VISGPPPAPTHPRETHLVQELIQPILNLFKPETLVSLGYLVMTIIVFTETGLLIGFCLPGDSLLVTAGIFAAKGQLDFWTLNACLIPAAILGDSLGYWIGLKTGPHLFNRQKSRLFNPAHLREAHEFYERHGGKTIVIARFMPIVRTFAPLVAGMGRMNYKSFLLYNVFGGIGWVLGMSGIGYIFGKKFPWAVSKLEYIILVVVVVSILPAAIPIAQRWLKNRKAKGAPVAAEPSAEVSELV
jgi:membrane-associated protein